MNLKLLVTMLLRGADIVDQDSSDSQACLSDHSLQLQEDKQKEWEQSALLGL